MRLLRRAEAARDESPGAGDRCFPVGDAPSGGGGRRLLTGNEAMAEAAVRAGCRFYFGYPITPQSELLEYMARRLPELGGTFVQAESETAAVNMVYGAAGAGVRVLTSTSSPGFSLMAEGVSYLVGAELPCVLINMSRGGPGLGGVAPAQSDYFQATRGPGHGDHRLLVLAPASVQEAADLTWRGFDLAERYRNPVLILGDGLLAQMMEPVTPPPFVSPDALPPKPWATTGRGDRPYRNVINSLRLDADELWRFNRRLAAKYERMTAREVRWEEWWLDGAAVVVVAYGLLARICLAAVLEARRRGVRAGLLRPVTLWPFPVSPLRRAAAGGSRLVVVEMSLGQMVEDVRLAVGRDAEVHQVVRAGGVVPDQEEVLAVIEEVGS